MKRVIITVNVPDNMSDGDIATWIEGVDKDLQDPVVWEWPKFWLDVEEGLVGPAGDGAAKGGWNSPEGERAAKIERKGPWSWDGAPEPRVDTADSP